MSFLTEKDLHTLSDTLAALPSNSVVVAVSLLLVLRIVLNRQPQPWRHDLLCRRRGKNRGYMEKNIAPLKHSPTPKTAKAC
ncbi:hypothetical protein P4S70_16840 [Enterovibrio sp. Hal110]